MADSAKYFVGVHGGDGEGGFFYDYRLEGGEGEEGRSRKILTSTAVSGGQGEVKHITSLVEHQSRSQPHDKMRRVQLKEHILDDQ
jgi:hypothetical protein